MKLILSFILSAICIYASDAFISPEDLNIKMKNKNLVILDVTTKEAYSSEHIPGAINVNVGDFRKKVTMHQRIKSPDEIQSIIRSLGINNDSEVVIYGHGKAKELMKSTYLALALITHGVEKVSILNGGFTAWASEYIDSESEAPAVIPGNFVAKYDNSTLVDMNYVKNNIGKLPMFDSRGPRNYYGTVKSGGVERLGHIPKAKSSFWEDKFTSEQTVREDEVLQAMVVDSSGLDLDQEIIIYCTGGLEASANWYIFSQHLGFKNIKLYDGSMREWGNRDDTPMTIYKWE